MDTLAAAQLLPPPYLYAALLHLSAVLSQPLACLVFAKRTDLILIAII
jgi:hypothetical protein